MIAEAKKYWNTVRYLRPVQIYGRLWFRLTRPAVDRSPPPAVRPTRGGVWVSASVDERAPSMVGPTRFRFLNEVYDLIEHGWDDPTLDKLWRYNLHYFNDLNALDAASRHPWHHALVVRWILENPPGVGTGWEPYPTSLRIVNWIKWASRGNSFSGASIESLATQIRWLSGRLETHLLGNHLFANAKALVFAGLYFEGSEADAWLDRGLRILAKEVPEQILSDGGHFERSPMYHSLALEDMLDLINATAIYSSAVPPHWRATIDVWAGIANAMRSWLAAMVHPDAEISLFNDAAIGIAPPPIALEHYARALGLPEVESKRAVTPLFPSGYVRVERGGAVALLDVAPLGPDYLLAHAHADTLTFELSLSGHRLVVNSGVSLYGTSPERLRQRGTAAHNTVVINGENSSNVWSGFRVAQRARPNKANLICDESILIECSHDGYERLPGKPRHNRKWTFSSCGLVVEDSITGTFRTAQARFHLHPSVIVCRDKTDSIDAKVDLLLPGGNKVGVMFEGGRMVEERTSWHPEFGISQPNTCMVVEFVGRELQTEFRWEKSG